MSTKNEVAFVKKYMSALTKMQSLAGPEFMELKSQIDSVLSGPTAQLLLT